MGKIKISEKKEKILRETLTVVTNRPHTRMQERALEVAAQIIADSTMDYVKKVEHLRIEGNLAENWRVFRANFEIFATAIEITKKGEAVKVAIFLNAIGPDAVEVYNSLNLAEEVKASYEAVIQAFDDFCKPKTNEVYEAFLFYNRFQGKEEPFDTFYMDIKKLIRTCGFGASETRMLRDRIVHGIADKQLQKKMLETEPLDCAKAVSMAKAAEAARRQVNEMQRHSTHTSTVDALTVERRERETNKGHSAKQNERNGHEQRRQRNRRGERRSGDEQSSSKCKYCDLSHSAGKCPAYGQKCKKCGKNNHYAVVCHTKTVRMISETPETWFVNAVSQRALTHAHIAKWNEKSQWWQTVKVNDVSIDCKLDTGAEVNILPIKLVERMKNVKWMQHEAILEAYGGFRLDSVGKIEAVTIVKNTITTLEFVVVKSDSTPLLGAAACEELNLVKRVHALNDSRQTKSQVVNKNADVFDGLGCFVENVDLELIEDAKGVIRPARRIPLAIMDAVKQQLDRMEQREVIVKSNGTSEWVSNLVVVEKANKTLRLCIDPQELNRNLRDENYLIPSFDEVCAKLAGKKWFSVLDLKDGYWQIKLSEKASHLCTFSTPFGNYRFLRLPFGLKVAAQLFQKFNDMNFRDLAGVTVYIDDILIAADTQDEHDAILHRVIERAKQKNVKFNKEKFQFCLPSVKYLGHIMSANGITVDPERIEAIQHLGAPNNKTDLQKLMGLVNYVRSFVPNLAEISEPLRQLLKKNVIFQWQPQHEATVTKIKQMIAGAPTLKAFDTKKAVIIETDASKSGLGCCLKQDNKPVGFASRSLTEAEERYAQIEKEMLAIVFACNKFHLFIYGRRIEVQTDHQPLLGIMRKDLASIPSPRLQRMKLRLLKYTLELKHVPGKQMYISDYLSRYYSKQSAPPEIPEIN